MDRNSIPRRIGGKIKSKRKMWKQLSEKSINKEPKGKKGKEHAMMNIGIFQWRLENIPSM